MKEINENEEINSEAKRYALANTYSLDNSYLTSEGKMSVELWFQFPSTIMFIAVCLCMIYSINNYIPLKYIIGIPMVIDIVIGLINYYINLKRVLKIFFLTIGHKFILWILTLLTIYLLAYNGFYVYSVLILFCKLGLLTFISPSLYIYTILSRKYKMHAKWAFFKRFYGYEFPFEKETERPT